MLISRTELLAKLPIFRGLSEKQLNSIVEIASKAFFEAGDNLITKDEVGHASFFIMTGSAICINFHAPGGVGPVIEAGSLVGELAMLVDTIHSFTVQAREKLRAMAIDRHSLTRAMERDPAIAQQISDNLLIRLEALARDLRRLDGVLAKVGMSSEAHVTYKTKQYYSSVAIAELPQQTRADSITRATATIHYRDLRDDLPVSDTKREEGILELHHYIRRAKMLFRDITQKSVA